MQGSLVAVGAKYILGQNIPPRGGTKLAKNILSKLFLQTQQQRPGNPANNSICCRPFLLYNYTFLSTLYHRNIPRLGELQANVSDSFGCKYLHAYISLL